MTNEVPAATREKLVRSTLPTWVGGTYRALAVNSTYVFSSTHANLSDIPVGARIGSVNLASKTTDGNGRGSCANPTVIPCPTGTIVRGVWVYNSQGTEAASTLLSWHDTSMDGTTLFSTTEDTTGIAIQWTAGYGVFAII